jgi:type II secretory ATPase GspE/PulE/Tfp pilus assembly ATPase PilB-like protein
MRRHIEEAQIDPGQLYRGTGCEHCHDSGYLGRVGIYEMLIIDDDFRNIINKDPSVAGMRRLFNERDCKTLFKDGMAKVRAGLTTIDEVLRVTEISTASPHENANS